MVGYCPYSQYKSQGVNTGRGSVHLLTLIYILGVYNG
jgi:hypothetical protein